MGLESEQTVCTGSFFLHHYTSITGDSISKEWMEVHANRKLNGLMQQLKDYIRF